MIKIRDLTKSFGETVVLDHVNMTVPKGSIYGLVGPNGAGKSTLIRLLTDIYRPDGGEIMIDGENVRDNPGIKARVRCIYDEIFHYMNVSTRDMMLMMRKLYPNFDLDLYYRLGTVFPEVDERTPIKRLSKGMMKQSAFRLSLSCRPEVLILDEPVDGLDPVVRRNVWSLLMADVEAHGTTVLLSSHNLRELEDVCDYVGILNRGRMMIEQSLSDMQDNIAKVQIIFDENNEPAQFGDVQILSRSRQGRMQSLIVRMSPQKAVEYFSAFNPVYVETIPLNLEEIFIYEMGGVNHEAKEILM